MPVYVFAQSENGWIGFDPGIPQAANVGPFRLRWVEMGEGYSLQGACDPLPIVEAPPPDVCFTMAMTEFPVYATSSQDSDILTMMQSEDYVAVIAQSSPDWFEVDLSIGSLGVPETGWVESQWINLNGPCQSLLIQGPEEPGMTLLSEGEEPIISYIHMLTPLQGWAIGYVDEDEDHVLYTEDGGKSWVDVSPPEPGVSEGQLKVKALGSFLDAQIARIAYRVYFQDSPFYFLRFWTTDDGGVSWTYGGETTVLDINELDQPLKFIDSSHGWLLHESFVGAGHHRYEFFQSQDGGKSYDNLHETQDTSSTCHSTDFAFSDASFGWMTLHCPFLPGAVYVATTYDGGISWESLTLPPPTPNPDIFRESSSCWTESPHLFSQETGALSMVCVLEDGQGSENFVLLTDDGGLTWESHQAPEGKLLLLEPAKGWILGRDIHWSDNGGRDWDYVKSVSWDGQFSFVNDLEGWAVARSEDEIALVITRDGGQSWALIEPSTNEPIRAETSGEIGYCKLVAVGPVTAYRRPSFAATEFAEVPVDIILEALAQTSDGWIGFDPATAQAANIGVFRLRWVPPGSALEMSEDCASLPIVEGPKPGICFTMPMSETPIYSSPDTSTEVVATLVLEDYVEVEGRYGSDWVRVDLSEGNLAMPIMGWMESFHLNLNCPNMDLPEVSP